MNDLVLKYTDSESSLFSGNLNPPWEKIMAVVHLTTIPCEPYTAYEIKEKHICQYMFCANAVVHARSLVVHPGLMSVVKDGR